MMLLTMLAYAMIIVFMYVVMKKKMTPFTALVMIPLIMTIAVILICMVSTILLKQVSCCYLPFCSSLSC